MLSFYRTAMAIGLALVVSGPAYAAAITYANQASFLAAVGTTITDDYSNPGYLRSFGPNPPQVMTDAYMSGVLNQTKYKTTTIPNGNIVIGPAMGGNPFYCSGCNATYDLNFQTTSLSTGGGVFGVSFNYRNGGLPGGTGTYDFLVTFADGTFFDYTTPMTTLSGQTPDFFGLTATQQIRDIYFGLNGKPGLGPVFHLDNLTIAGAKAVTPVPEPLTLGMFGAGLAGMATMRRRRVRAS
jgi:hypothetical protein